MVLTLSSSVAGHKENHLNMELLVSPTFNLATVLLPSLPVDGLTS